MRACAQLSYLPLGEQVIAIHRERRKNHRKVTKRLQTQMRSLMFDALHTISFISFLSAFKLASYINGVHDGTVICFFDFLMKGFCADVPSARFCLKPTSSSNTSMAKKGMLHTYLDVVSSLLWTYTTNDVIAETDSALTRHTQASTMSPWQYAKALETKSRRCADVYDGYVLKTFSSKAFTNQSAIVCNRTTVST